MSKYTTEIDAAALNGDGLSEKAGWLTVYHAHPDTREYLNASYEYLLPGVGLPAHSYADAPELPPDGQALCRSVDGGNWEHLPDYRGQTVYDVATRAAQAVTAIGALAQTLTPLAPDTEYDIWDGDKWVTDATAQQQAETQAVQQAAQQELDQRLAEATARIQALGDAVDLGMATEEETAALTAWKTYRVLLSRIDIAAAPDIEWPDAPEG